MFTRQRIGSPAEVNPSAALGTRGQPFTNVHHDRNKNEWRVATVIAYLSNSSDADGGHTLFPTLRSRVRPVRLAVGITHLAGHSPSAEPLASSAIDEHTPAVWHLSESLAAAYSHGVRSVGCERCSDSSQPQLRAAVRYCEDECARARDGSSNSLAVRPQAGSAVVFWSVRADGEPDATMFHTGCYARTGPHRLILQKFKSRRPANDAERQGAEAALTRRDSTATSHMPTTWAVSPLGSAGDELPFERPFEIPSPLRE